jgi:type II secretory pathway pseudopilin PulG
MSLKRSILCCTGFSLVELSVVLVTLGLLTGGILTGKSLIKAAELRAEMTNLQNYETAISAFSDKYYAIPGDMANATAYWGTATANGDGDGQLESATPNNGSYISPDNGKYDGEKPHFFKQLGLAGLITQNFDGSTTLGTGYPTTKINTGAGMFASSKWDSANIGNDSFANSNQIITANLYMVLAVALPSFFGIDSNFNDDAAVYTAEDVWNMDKKLDDGKPASGKVKAQALRTSCTSGTDYNLATASSGRCNMLYELIQ